MAVRRQDRIETSDAMPFDQRAYAWLSSHEAEVYTKGVLKRSRLRIEPSEILSDAMRKVFMRFHDRPELLEDEKWKTHPADNYCKSAIRNLVTDVFRGRKRSGLSIRDDDVDERFQPFHLDSYDTDEPQVDDASPEPKMPGGELHDRVRVELENSGAKSWIVSAALTWFTLAAYPTADTGKSPQPEAGAKPLDARMWPCLWFAGQRELFTEGGLPSSQALRKKRSNRIKDVNRLIFDVRLGMGFKEQS